MSKFLMPKAWSPKSQTKKNNWSTVRSTLSHAIHEFQLASAGVLGVAQGTAQSHGEEGENQWVLAHQLHLRWLDKYGNPHGKHVETHANATSSTIFMKKTWSNMIDSPLLWKKKWDESGFFNGTMDSWCMFHCQGGFCQRYCRRARGITLNS
jgi:hypothetical protein